MPNPNAIVSVIVRLDPPLERTAGEMLRSERGLSVELDGGRRVRLDAANPRSAGFAQVLHGLGTLRMPVYLEIDPATEAVTRLLVPHVARVIRVTAAGDTLDVELDRSHARHALKLGTADAPAIELELRRALEQGGPVILSEDDAHFIIDVRPFTPFGDGILPPFPPFPLPNPPPFPQFRWLPDWLWKFIWTWWPWRGCITASYAQQVFNSMAATSCAPLTVPPPCIPFMYPDDGCWARAHEMCRLMINMGLSSRKVWIDSTYPAHLHVSTRNNPNCSVNWGWHVAPTLCVRTGAFFQTQRMVIDPSLFTTPVSEATWKSVQGDPNATLTETGPEQFWHNGGTDPTYSASNAILAQYRLALQSRAIQVGPPPYANCP